MDIVSQRLYATGKTFRISLYEAVGIALSVPAVVEVYISVSCIAHSRFHKGVGDASDEFFIDIAGKFIPGIPSHLRTVAYLLPFLCHQAVASHQ